MKAITLCFAVLLSVPAFLSAQEKSTATPKAAAPAKMSAPAKPSSRNAAAAPVAAADLAKSTVPAKPVYEKKESWFSIPSVDGGKNIDLQTYAGHPVVVIMLSADCHFCRKAVPFFQKAYGIYKDRGLGMVGVALDDDAAYVKAFARDNGLTFPIGSDPSRRVARAYKSRGVPWITVLDKDHNIQRSWIGYTQEYDEEILRTLDALLK